MTSENPVENQRRMCYVQAGKDIARGIRLMKTKIIILVLVVVAIAVVGIVAMNMRQQTVTPKPVEEPLARAKFVLIYADLAIAGEKIGVGTPQYETVRDSILKSYGTTFEILIAMQSSLDTQPEKWARVWEDILAELQRRKAPLLPSDSVKS